MTAGAFSRFCIYMIMAQMVFSLIAAAAELILNQLGLSMDTLTELASVGSDMGIMMMIYAGFVGRTGCGRTRFQRISYETV